jgi:hypothetical protein
MSPESNKLLAHLVWEEVWHQGHLTVNKLDKWTLHSYTLFWEHSQILFTNRRSGLGLAMSLPL